MSELEKALEAMMRPGFGERPTYDNAAFQDTDDAEIVTILAAVRHCADSWDGNARLLGNVRARDISRACSAAIKALCTVTNGAR